MKENNNIEDWKKIYKTFFNDNEHGGSSRWLVNPDVVELFIIGVLRKHGEAERQKGRSEAVAYIRKHQESVLITRLDGLDWEMIFAIARHKGK